MTTAEELVNSLRAHGAVWLKESDYDTLRARAERYPECVEEFEAWVEIHMRFHPGVSRTDAISHIWGNLIEAYEQSCAKGSFWRFLFSPDE